MAKKKRKPHKKPMRTPLSKLDKLVYNVAIVASVVLCFGSILIFLLISSNIAFADPAVIAVHWEGFHVLYQVPIMVFFAVLAVFFSVLQSNKKPLFENKSFKPRDGQPYKKETPVFSAEFWRNMSEKMKLKIYLGAVITVVCFIISLLISLLGIYPRTVLLGNDEIKRYNSFNEITETHNIKNADKLIFSIGISSSKSGTSYFLRCGFVYGDGEYRFEHTAFDDMETEEILEYMLRLKSDFAGKCVIKDSDYVKALCKDRNFTEAEKALVYELFDYTE